MSSPAESERARNVRLRTLVQPEAPIVSLRLFVPGGGRSEEKLGLACATGRLLAESTLRRDRISLLELLESRGISLTSSATFEGHGLAVEAPADDWPLALEIALEVLLEPAFDAERLLWVLEHMRSDLAGAADEPGTPTAWRFVEQLYAPHRRAYPLLGDPRTAAGLEAADLSAFHRRRLDRECIVTAAGAFDERQLTERVEGALGPPVPGAVGEPFAPPRPDAGDSDRGGCLDWVPVESAQQCHLYVGRLTVARASPDLLPLALAAVALGAGPGLQGRIPLRVREQEGLAYLVDVATTTGAGIDPGCLDVHVVSSPDHGDRIEELVREELGRAASDGFSDGEVQAAREYFLGTEPFRRETAPQCADLLIAEAFYDRPLADPNWFRQQIRAVTHEGVNRAAARYLDPASTLTVRGGGERTA